MAQENSSSTSSSNLPLIIIYWAIVGLPLCWGIYKTVQKSIPLFQPTKVETTGKPAAAPATTATPAPLATATPAKIEIAPTPAASPFTTPQPSATIGPITTPAPPAG